MGLENRDYVRDGSYTAALSGLGLDFTPVVKYLIIANVVVFLLQIFIVRSTLPDLPEIFPNRIPPRPAEHDGDGTGGKKARGPAQGVGKEGIDPEQVEEIRRKARRVLEQVRNQLPGARVSVVQEWFELDPQKTVQQGQVWRLVTCAFCHSRQEIWHIVVNMFLLYWFGTRLESLYGSREFLLFYLAAAVSGSVAYVALALYSDSNVPAIGASGAVMGVMMLYTLFYPFETFLFCWIIPVPLWVLLGIYVLYDLHPVLLTLSGDQVFTGVAHAGHLGGLAFGLLYWKLRIRLEAPFARGERPRLLVRRPPKPAAEPAGLAQLQRNVLNEQVDEILRKISEQGQASLTEQERAILTQASVKYRRGK
jgi:membrane associated rhomboid family serine protease